MKTKMHKKQKTHDRQTHSTILEEKEPYMAYLHIKYLIF